MTFISTRAASFSLPPARRDRLTSIGKLIPITMNRSGSYLPELEPGTDGWCLNCADTFWQFRRKTARMLRSGSTKFSDVGRLLFVCRGCNQYSGSHYFIFPNVTFSDLN